MYKRIKQTNIMDCGVVCLLNIIRFYGGNNSLYNLRNLTNCDKAGVCAYDLIQASKKLGFDAYAIKCDIEYIKNNVEFPVIAHTLINNSYKHYVVIEKIEKNKIIVFDPADKLKKYNFSDFEKIFTNVLIVLKPIRKLDYIKPFSKKKLYFDFIHGIKRKYIVIVFLSIFIIFLMIINTFYFKILIDNNINNIFIIFLGIILLKSIIEIFRNNLSIFLNKKISEKVMNKVYEKTLSLPNCYFESRHIGDLINKFSNLDFIVDLIVNVPIVIIIDFFLVFSVFIVLININLMLFLIFFIFLFSYFIVFLFFNNKNKIFVRKKQEKSSEFTQFLEESISGINTIKNMDIEKEFMKKQQKVFLNYNNIKEKFEKNYNLQTILKNTIILIGINTILYLGILQVNNGYMLLSNLILFNSFIFYLIDPVKNIFELEEIIKNGLVQMERIIDIFEYEKNYGIIEDDIKKLEFKKLNFSYKSDAYILKNFNLKIDNNDKVFLYGDSGTGKSTLFKILLNYYKLNKNEIFLNDKDINLYSKRCLIKNIKYISSNEKMFNSSLYSNILLDKSISRKKINKIMKLVYLKKCMYKNKVNIHSSLLDNGNNFSLGEKQRIIIARCLLRDSNILILDEALNAVDINLERKILKNILKYKKNNIIIYVSHRKKNMDLFSKTININNLERG